MYKFIDTITAVRPSPPGLSDEFLSKLIKFYSKQSEWKNKVSHIWEQTEILFHGPIKSALENKSLPRLRSALEGVYFGDAINGMDIPASLKENEHLFLFTPQFLDTAICSGVLPMFNSNQAVPIDNLTYSGVLDAIEVVAGGKINHPGGGGMTSIAIGERKLPVKMTELLRVFLASIKLMDSNSPNNVIEIGGGCGFIAFIFCSLRNNCRYHLFDLPIVSVMQAFLVATALGESNVGFFDESDTKQVTIWGLNNPNGIKMDLAINVNSFPEIPEAIGDQYLSMLETILKPSSCLLSVNHESNRGGQFRLFGTIQAHPRFASISRSPAWGYPGYVQEIWKLL